MRFFSPDFNPKYIIFHDTEGWPTNTPGGYTPPYNVTVYPDGSYKFYNSGNNPFSSPTPSNHNLNAQSISIAYAGPSGSVPTPQAMARLQGFYDMAKAQYPGIKGLGHGEAYKMWQEGDLAQKPSATGRDVHEAAWRYDLQHPNAQFPDNLTSAPVPPTEQGAPGLVVGDRPQGFGTGMALAQNALPGEFPADTTDYSRVASRGIADWARSAGLPQTQVAEEGPQPPQAGLPQRMALTSPPPPGPIDRAVAWARDVLKTPTPQRDVVGGADIRSPNDISAKSPPGLTPERNKAISSDSASGSSPLGGLFGSDGPFGGGVIHDTMGNTFNDAGAFFRNVDSSGFAAGGATKSTKAAARYQDRPSGNKRCDRCTMFVRPHDCTAVHGRIAAHGWCKYFEPKDKRAAGGPVGAPVPPSPPMPPKAPGLAADAPSAEPVADILAQARDLADPKNPRQGLWLPLPTLTNLTPGDAQQLEEILGPDRAGVENFDGQGGFMVTKDQHIADRMVEARDGGVDLQKIIGLMTGDGVGKPANGDRVVQQVTPTGAVARERLIGPDEQNNVMQEFAHPGRATRILSAPDVLARRAMNISRGDGGRVDLDATARAATGLDTLANSPGLEPLTWRDQQKLWQRRYWDTPPKAPPRYSPEAVRNEWGRLIDALNSREQQGLNSYPRDPNAPMSDNYEYRPNPMRLDPSYVPQQAAGGVVKKTS